MRKRYVYALNDRRIELRSWLKKGHEKTYFYQKVKLNIAFVELKIAMFDGSGAITAQYELDRWNKAIKTHKKPLRN